MNPIRLVSGAIALPAHAAAAVLGASVGIATTGALATARAVGRVIERASAADRAAPGPWPEPPAAREVDPIPGTRTHPAAGAEPAAAPEQAPARKQPTATPATRPARKTATKTAKTTAKTAAKKAPSKAPRKASSKQAAVLAPALGLSETEVEKAVADSGTGSDDGPTTPSGIPAAGAGVNPDTTETDLHQPGTEPLMDPATVKSVASESDVLRRAAEVDKG
ncbi:hypothetical protein [Nocardioides sp. zg-1228]|uniref:hypothetical protein n=1 Tax=Nocardioides sp. zg-1228 TaxID=2763008 RepID=UPI0016424EB3|nr:hypothetical protein [Nocardioides sp. zg-1228]MBC2933971.1 hypothetical protein [Nocardioides sp. zg-1228]QSF58730.1 hypothetical protein JX575_05960 [Nocardioides sp. zg-1228]